MRTRAEPRYEEYRMTERSDLNIGLVGFGTVGSGVTVAVAVAEGTGGIGVSVRVGTGSGTVPGVFVGVLSFPDPEQAVIPLLSSSKSTAKIMATRTVPPLALSQASPGAGSGIRYPGSHPTSIFAPLPSPAGPEVDLSYVQAYVCS